jgi:hypothetical protein
MGCPGRIAGIGVGLDDVAADVGLRSRRRRFGPLFRRLEVVLRRLELRRRLQEAGLCVGERRPGVSQVLLHPGLRRFCCHQGCLGLLQLRAHVELRLSGRQSQISGP